MEPPTGARTFLTTGEAYDSFMGRYSAPLAHAFADMAGVVPGMTLLDVGCGPGALTSVLAERLGATAVQAVDPSPPFVAACAARCPGVQVQRGKAESLPFPDDSFDAVLSQLVLHFVEDPAAVGREFRRVVRSGGTAAACVWDAGADGIEMLRAFWEAARAIGSPSVDDASGVRFGRPGEIVAWLDEAGFTDIIETKLEVSSTYIDFDELWAGYLHGIGPAGAFLLALSDSDRTSLRTALFDVLGSPTDRFTLHAVAHSAVGRAPT